MTTPMRPCPFEADLAIVDAALRATFPDDFDRRCMYAAFGLRDRLRAAGHLAEILAGDFLCFSLSQDGSQAILDGFGTVSADPPSHFWVEAAGIRLDLGPCYLPRRARFAAVDIPPLCWALSVPLPHYLRYRPSLRYHPDVELAPDSPLIDRLASFRAACTRDVATTPQPPWRWVLRSPGAVTAAARSGDPWARGARRFLRVAQPSELPF